MEGALLRGVCPSAIYRCSWVAGQLCICEIDGFTSHLTQNRSFWKRSSQPIFWFSTVAFMRNQRFKTMFFFHFEQQNMHHNCQLHAKV